MNQEEFEALWDEAISKAVVNFYSQGTSGDIELLTPASLEQCIMIIDHQYEQDRNPYKWAKDMYNLLHPKVRCYG